MVPGSLSTCLLLVLASLVLVVRGGASLGASGDSEGGRHGFGRVQEFQSQMEAASGEQNLSRMAQALGGEDRTVILVNVAGLYMDFVLNWYRTVQQFGYGSKVLFVAEDRESFQFLSQHWPAQTVMVHKTTSLPGDKNHASIGTPFFHGITNRKQAYILALLHHNFTVLFNDVDMVWLKDPFSILNSAAAQSYDALFQDDGSSFADFSTRFRDGKIGTVQLDRTHTLCGCFLFLKPTPGTKALVKLWRDRVKSASSRKATANDQTLLNEVVKEVVDSGAMVQSIGTEGRVKLTLGVLPIQNFPSGCAFFRNVKEPCKSAHVQFEAARAQGKADPFVAHSSWAFSIDSRVKRFKHVAQWDPAIPEGTASAATYEAAAQLAEQDKEVQIIRNLLKQYTGFPTGRGGVPGGHPFCGTWAQGYAQLHRQIRSGELPARFMTWDWPRGGLGVQLLGITSVFLAALLTDRAIILRDANLEAAFESGNVDWRLRDDVPMTTTDRASALREPLVNRNEADEWGNQVVFPTDFLSIFEDPSMDKATNIIVPADGGIVLRLFGTNTTTSRKLRELGLHTANTYPCVLRFLLRPRPEVIETAARAMSRLSEPDLCIHVRTSDKLSVLSAQRRQAVWQEVVQNQLLCALALSRRHLPRPARWLVLADNQWLKDKVHVWGKNFSSFLVMTTDIKPRHQPHSLPSASSDSWIVGNAAEWLLFSTCRLHLFTPSAFSKTSWAYNFREPAPYVVPVNFQKPWLVPKNEYWNCAEPTPSPLSALLPAAGF